MSELESIIMDAEKHYLVNGSTYVCKNDNGFYYCNEASLSQLNIRDNNLGLNPVVLGHWHKNTITLCNGEIMHLAHSYYSYNDQL